MNRLSLIAAGATLVLAACGSASAQAPAAAPAATTDHTAHTATAAAATTAATAASTAPTPAQAAAAATPAPATATPAPAAAATTNPIVAPAFTLQPTAAPIAPAPTAPAEATPAPATPAPTTAPAPPAGTVVNVTLIDSGIKLSRTSAPAGTVTFSVTNGGTVVHEFVVLKTDIAQNAIPVDPSQPALVTEPGYLGKVSALAPGASGSLTLTLGHGNYVVICNELAHYMIGMHAAFTVN